MHGLDYTDISNNMGVKFDRRVVTMKGLVDVSLHKMLSLDTEKILYNTYHIRRKILTSRYNELLTIKEYKDKERKKKKKG